MHIGKADKVKDRANSDPSLTSAACLWKVSPPVRPILLLMPRELTPVEVLTVLLQRLEKRAECLEGVKLKEYNMVLYELRNFAKMVRAARDDLAKRQAR